MNSDNVKKEESSESEESPCRKLTMCLQHKLTTSLQTVCMACILESMIRMVGGVLRQTGNYMQDSTSWRGWRREQKS